MTSTATQAPTRTLVGFDTETHLIGPENVFPKIVCLTVLDEHGYEMLASTHDSAEKAGIADLRIMADTLFDPQDHSLVKVGANAAFDMGVLARAFPHLLPAIFDHMERGQVKDVQIREKLLNLAEFGRLDKMELPNGASQRISYSLASLVKQYIGDDLTAEKTQEDAWRTNYSVLENMPVSEWPDDAANYALLDSGYTLQVYMEQEKRRAKLIDEIGTDPLAVEDYRVAKDFALKLLTAHGVAVDAQAKARVEQMLAEELAPEKLDLLIRHKILSPGRPPEPYKNKTKDHIEGCDRKGDCDCPLKMKRAVPEKISKTTLQKYVIDLASRNADVTLKYNDPTETELAKAEAEGREPEGNLCIDAEWLGDHEGVDPVLDQYLHRQKLQKLVTTELPRMEWEVEGVRQTASVVHPEFDVLKETGRTSSYAGKLYPSFNGQNVDPRARQCFVPRPGRLLFSVDYNQMELGTAAQTCINLFGYSVLGDKINAGYDTHGYLGAQLALHLDEGFGILARNRNLSDPDEIYHLFMSLKSDPNDHDGSLGKLWKHYRTFAKPTGLGYPGGLGVDTFVKYAKATYGVIVERDTAQMLKDIWLETFPEFKQYFEYIKKQAKDPRFEDSHCYQTPLGMFRSNASYCAAANGMALQSPSAEGALLALYEVVRECYDPSRESVLYGGCWPSIFIHDEIVGEVVDDELAHDRVLRVGQIMVDQMRHITPDVEPRFGPALMRRWDKRAEAVYDANGRLVPWEPKPE